MQNYGAEDAMDKKRRRPLVTFDGEKMEQVVIFSCEDAPYIIHQGAQNKEEENGTPFATWKMKRASISSDGKVFRELNQKVLADSAKLIVTDTPRLSFSILVENVGYLKHVWVRYTTNNWISYVDREAQYYSHMMDYWDQFVLDVDIDTLLREQYIKDRKKSSTINFCFAVRYLVQTSEYGLQEYWDNNSGLNYDLVLEKSHSFSHPLNPPKYSPIIKNTRNSINSECFDEKYLIRNTRMNMKLNRTPLRARSLNQLSMSSQREHSSLPPSNALQKSPPKFTDTIDSKRAIPKFPDTLLEPASSKPPSRPVHSLDCKKLPPPINISRNVNLLGGKKMGIFLPHSQSPPLSSSWSISPRASCSPPLIVTAGIAQLELHT